VNPTSGYHPSSATGFLGKDSIKTRKIAGVCIALLVILSQYAFADFTIGIIPDTQKLSDTAFGSDGPQMMKNIAQFFVDHKAALNVVMVAHVGDMTEKIDASPGTGKDAQWQRNKDAWDILLNANIPFAPCQGNHDPDLSNLNKYFPVSTFSQLPYWGGSRSGQIENAYYLFTADGMDFILGVSEFGRNTSVNSWLNGVYTTYAARRGILISHSGLSQVNSGAEDWLVDDVIRKHDNIFLANMGHLCENNGNEHWTSTSPSGDIQHLIRTDYQCRGKPYNNNPAAAMFRYYTFKPNENRVYAYTYNIRTQFYETDGDSQFSFYYNMGPPLIITNIYFSTTSCQGSSATTGWNAAIWQTNSAGTLVGPAVGPPVAGNSYSCLSNGVAFGKDTDNTIIRNPFVSGQAAIQTFAGDSLTLYTDTEIRFKRISSGNVPTSDFPGVGGNPGLILDGGLLVGGDAETYPVTGRIRVASQSYFALGSNGGGNPSARRFNVSATITGSGNLVFFNGSNDVAQVFSGTNTTCSGTWIIKSAWVQFNGTNSLGTNSSILVDPLYTLPLNSGIVNVPGPAELEVGYDVNSAGTLTLINGGKMRLHQNCAFTQVIIQNPTDNGGAGTNLSQGTHSYTELRANFPNTFPAGGSGSLAVLCPLLTLNIGFSEDDLELTWPQGTLLEATNIMGPWTTNLAASPHLVPATEARKFFRVQSQQAMVR
jgi:hypothetical protein